MKRLPWPLFIIAILYIIAPIWNSWMNAHILGVTQWEYVTTLWQTDLWAFFRVFAVLPLGGLSIILARRTTYWFFLVVQSGIFAYLVYQYALFHEIFPVWMFAFGVVVNSLIIAYFSVPSVRLVYFNSSYRWWQRPPRFVLKEAAKVFHGTVEHPGTILNLSAGGLFFESKGSIPAGQSLAMTMSFQGQEYGFAGIVRHNHTLPSGMTGHGLLFEGMTDGDRAKVKGLVKLMKKHGYETTLNPGPWSEDLKNWAKDLVLRRKGLFPDIQK